MTKLSSQMQRHLQALEAGSRSAYPGLSLRTLYALQMRGLVMRTDRIGNMAFPHTSIRWTLTDAGRSARSNDHA